MSKIHLLPRLYNASLLQEGVSVTLDEAHTHQLVNVLRLSNDDEIRLFNSAHGEFLAKLEIIKKKNALAHITKHLQEAPSASKPLWLYFAPIKKQRLDFMVEKAVELGVTDFQPVITERTEVRELNKERMEAQIIEALEQCEGFHVPQLHSPLPLKNLTPEHTVFAAIERRHALPLKQALQTQKATGVLIGPEGGFTENEMVWLESNQSMIPISLGDRILRTETAALYALSLLN